MKKTINGRIYDTQKANMIGTRQVGQPEDYGYTYEALYETPRSGRYFLAGTGGPWSIYAKYEGNNTYGHGVGVRPLTEVHAKAWAFEYLNEVL